MNPVVNALMRALASQLHPRMLLLTLLPFAVTALIWTGVFWLAGEPIVNTVQGWLLHSAGFERLVMWAFSGNVDRFTWLIEHALPLAVVAFLAMPLVLMTVVLVVGVTTMPSVVTHLRRGRYSALALRGRSGWRSVLDDALHALGLTAIAVVLTIPLWLVPVVGWLLPLLLWGWINARIMTRDALSSHATVEEQRALVGSRRWPLWLLGIATGALGVVPALIWVGGVMAVWFWPAFALVSLWLYVFVFTYTALAFAHYTLSALERMRASAPRSPLPETIS